MNKRAALIAVYSTLNSLFLIKERPINIGNIGRMYLGRPLKVPVEIGIKKAITENIKYDNLIFAFQAI
ncbi:MAG: hypothetical protein AAB583_00420 [Patescibacteria group bacterium]